MGRSSGLESKVEYKEAVVRVGDEESVNDILRESTVALAKRKVERVEGW